MTIPGKQRNHRLIRVALLTLISVCVPAWSSSIQAQPAAKRVLVLYWDNKDFPGNIKFDENFKAQLGFVAPDAEYYPEYMETTRFPDANQSFFHDYLKQKYAGRKIDVVVASADIPWKFFVQYRSDLFSTAPIVFIANIPPTSEQILGGAGMTGIINQSTYRETMDLALKLHPNTEQLFVISGSPNQDKQFESVARAELAPYENRVKITYLTDLSLPDLIAKTASLPPRSIALYVWQQAVDERGRLLETYQVIARIAPTASAPIYGMGSGNLGQGIVGGYLQGPDHNGARTAEIVGRILNGKRARDIPVGNAPTVAMFDSRELKRWGISESSLPPSSVIEFKQLTFWEENKWFVIGTSTAILIEALLIGFLLITLRRVRSADRESKRLTGVSESAHRRLDEIISNVHGIVWESHIDPITNIRKTTFISDYVETMLGYTPEEWLAQPPGFGARLIHDDDRETALQQSEDVVATGRDGFSQFRWRTKDGRFIWTENFLTPIFDRNKKVIGLRGVAIDITDRKQAEETARLTEEKDRAILEAVPDLMFLHSPEGKYLDYHCKDVRQLSVPPEKFMGRNVRDVLPKELSEKLLNGFERVKDGAEPYMFEYRLPINGHHRWYEARMVPSAGNILTVVRDITDRREAEESLRRAEEKDRAILEAIPDLMFVQTRDGVYLDHHCNNPRDLLLPPEAFIGKNMREVLPPELADKFAVAFTNAFDTGETQLVEYELPLNGEPRWFEARIAATGENILSVIRDITQRVSSEAAIKRSEEQLAGVISSAMDGIITVDGRQKIILFNESAERIFGCPASEAVGKSIEQFIPERFRLLHRGHVDGFGTSAVTRRAMGERGMELYGLRRSGEEFPMEASISQIEVQGQRLYTVILRDITDRKRAEVALIESENSYRSIFNAANDAIFVHELETGAIIDVNERMCEMYECTAEDAMTYGITSLSANEPPYTGKEAMEYIRRAGAGTPQLFEWHAKKATGELFWVEVNLRYMSLRGRECLLAIVRDITERKLVAQELAESHRQVTDILESIGDAFYSVDNDLCFTYVNRKTEELWAKRRQDLLGRSFLDVFPEAIGSYSHRECLRARDEKRPINFEAISPILNRWVEASVYPTPAGLSIYFRDITERKQAADELRQSEERFGKAFRANPQPMSLTILDTGEYLDVNESFLEMSGFSREEVIGRTSLELNIWGSLEARDAFLQQLKQHGSVVNLETRFHVKDRSVRTLLSSAEQLEIEGRQCLLVASSDITERMLAQQALKESEARFRNMADTAPVMIWVADVNKNSTYFNQQWLNFTGRTMAEEVGSGWTAGIHPLDLDGCMKMFDAAFNSREPFRMEYRLRHHSGGFRWIIDTGTPRFSATGEFLGYIGSAVDITERKESEAAMVFAHEALENAYAEVNQLKTQLQEENVYLQEEIKLQQNFGEIVGGSDALKYVLFKIEQVAPTDSTVLITGDTGTGKELVARAIHTASTRRDRPMVKVNCAALSATLIESELFGHEKGAFTGALARKLGRFELADRATIFLDEIGELPLELQVKLLRIIQEGEFERLGSSKTVKVDVRVIAATNKNLREQVNKGLFREDLWYRLNVFPITVPPLRQRRDDIPMLIEHFARTFARKLGKDIRSVSPATINALRNYSWPGNVRELANVIERAVINSHGSVLRVQEQLRHTEVDAAATINRTLEEVERDYIIRVLEDRGWRIEGPHGAAHVLGMNPSTLRTRMGKLGINKSHQHAAGNGSN